jgi:glycosyltransferase involved in cell wall biosynthesis
MLDRQETRLCEVIFVDDGSTDDTVQIVSEFPVRLIRGKGEGAGAARNLGLREATGDLIWFVDSDCVSEPDALMLLLPHLEDEAVGGVGGSYGNMVADSLLGCLIHEEIVQRHIAMPSEVNFLATFNVLYRRHVLEQVGGFDVRFLKGQDAELAWRVIDAGYRLRFEIKSRVKHFHPTKWRSYLRVQRQQGYWRVFLHLEHKGHSAGDSYSSLLDHIQPPLSVLLLASLPLLVFPITRWVPALLIAALVLAPIPMTVRITARMKRAAYLLYGGMSVVRAFWRGFGMAAGTLAFVRSRGKSSA